jgi:hypothetical protein
MITNNLKSKKYQFEAPVSKDLDLSSYSKKIEKIFSEIAKKPDLNSCFSYFDELDEIQTELAKYLFKYDVKVSMKLKQFIKDFDRIDDIDCKLSMYRKIKSGNMINFYT